MKKILILFFILTTLPSFGQENELIIKTYNSGVTPKNIIESINIKPFNEIYVIDSFKNYHLIGCKKNSEYFIAYFVLDMNTVKSYHQPIPKFENGKSTTILNAKFDENGQNILFHDSKANDIFTVKRKIILENGK